MTFPLLRSAPTYVQDQGIGTPGGADIADTSGGLVLEAVTAATPPLCTALKILPILKGGFDERLVQENFDRVQEAIRCIIPHL